MYFTLYFDDNNWWLVNEWLFCWYYGYNIYTSFGTFKFVFLYFLLSFIFLEFLSRNFQKSKRPKVRHDIWGTMRANIQGVSSNVIQRLRGRENHFCPETCCIYANHWESNCLTKIIRNCSVVFHPEYTGLEIIKIVRFYENFLLVFRKYLNFFPGISGY